MTAWGVRFYIEGEREKPMKTALAAYAWPGGYPIMYLDEANAYLCVDCAQIDKDTGETVTPFIHWEGHALHCDECNKAIDSAYGPVAD